MAQTPLLKMSLLILQPFAIITYHHGLLLSHFDGNDHLQYNQVITFIKVRLGGGIYDAHDFFSFFFCHRMMY